MPCTVVDHEGQRAAMFVFSVCVLSRVIYTPGLQRLTCHCAPQDIAVRMEGRFVLRYRVFNISGAERCVPVLAECYGGTFEIFSTKSFPGLKASTDLTKVCQWLSVSSLPHVPPSCVLRRFRARCRFAGWLTFACVHACSPLLTEPVSQRHPRQLAPSGAQGRQEGAANPRLPHQPRRRSGRKQVCGDDGGGGSRPSRCRAIYGPKLR